MSGRRGAQPEELESHKTKTAITQTTACQLHKQGHQLPNQRLFPSKIRNIKAPDQQYFGSMLSHESSLDLQILDTDIDRVTEDWREREGFYAIHHGKTAEKGLSAYI